MPRSGSNLFPPPEHFHLQSGDVEIAPFGVIAIQGFTRPAAGERGGKTSALELARLHFFWEVLFLGVDGDSG